MASHFVVYRRLADCIPLACFGELSVAASTELSTEGFLVTRLLTGCCPKCGRSISRLSGAHDPMPLGYDA